MSISPRGIRFSTACVRKFTETEYVELRVHPHDCALAVVPCTARSKIKLRWARIQEGNISVRTVNGAAFLQPLYELFAWDTQKRYRLRGEIIRYGKDALILFDARMPEIFFSRYDFDMPWATGFGEAYDTASYSAGGIAPTSYLTYNTEPNLRPTPLRTAEETVRQLTRKLQRC